jgi:hypothetical protein
MHFSKFFYYKFRKSVPKFFPRQKNWEMRSKTFIQEQKRKLGVEKKHGGWEEKNPHLQRKAN